MMRWDDRQRAMLEALGIRLWWPGAAPAGAAGGQREASRVDAPGAALRGSDPPARDAAGPGAAPAPTQRLAPSPVGAAPLPAGAPAAAVDTMDWALLRDTVAACTACRLCETRTQTVFGVGHPQAHWMIVGEAPGEQEDRQGEPFVGKSGQLLDNMLRALGLTRAEAAPEQQVFIANTLKCRPPGNRNPEPDELAKCEPFLVRQLQLVQPRVILAMGRFAVQRLLRSDEPVGRLRGRVHHYQGVPLIVTYHPAYLLRNLADKARAWDDLCLALDTARRARTAH